MENHELTFSGSLPLDGRPEELLPEELTALMDDARSGSAGSENRMLLLTVDATMGYGDGRAAP